MITRRRFLQGVGAAGLAAGLENCGGGGGQKPTPRPAKPILVVVNIDGGNDWLNVMPPISGGNRSVYDALRPGIGIQNTGTLIDDLGGGMGLNKDFHGMFELHTLGRVAWIPGVGMPNPNLSHFVAIDLWGQGAASPNNTGWLGRFADASFSPTGDVLRGLTVTSDLPVMLRGASRSFVSITNSSGYVYPAMLRSGRLSTSQWDTQAIEDAYGTAVSAPVDPAAPAGMAYAEEVGKQFFDAQNGFGTNGTLNPRTPSLPYPNDPGHPIQGVSSSLANQFKLIAQMLANGIDAEVFYTRLGGWDTHANQATDHPRLMRALGASIRAFYEDLGSVSTPWGSAMDRTLIMAYSEFGRRVPENNGGTDHGTAGLAFCVGRGVAGGIQSAYPDLANLDPNKNMRFTVDFRSMYATVLERWLGIASAQVDSILGSTYPRLGFL
jgi:uncharacterized protein (DUF1501 family)